MNVTLGRPIFKSRTVLESSDQMQLKLVKPFFSKSLFKGREIDLKFCTTQKRNRYVGIVPIHGKVLVLYRKIELMDYLVFSFG